MRLDEPKREFALGRVKNADSFLFLREKYKPYYGTRIRLLYYERRKRNGKEILGL